MQQRRLLPAVNSTLLDHTFDTAERVRNACVHPESSDEAFIEDPRELFRLAKTEVGFGHFEGRSYRALMRHMPLCQLVPLSAAEQTGRLRGEKPGGDGGADRAGAEHAVPRVA